MVNLSSQPLHGAIQKGRPFCLSELIFISIVQLFFAVLQHFEEILYVFRGHEAKANYLKLLQI
jgi:hypothetical protein